jgi:hypothetical protein
MSAERAGVPAVAVITDTFVATAHLMAEVGGVPDYRFAVIGHPVSSDGPDDLRRKAAETVRQAVSLLTR